MRTTFAFTIVIGLLVASALGVTAAQRAQQVSNPPAPSIEDVLKAVRGDLQAERADIIAKNITLTSDQAAKFWPVFQQYQKEQNLIMDEQLKGIQQYVDGYQTLDDAGALGLINAHFDRDAKMNMLRQRWLAEFRNVLPTRLAVRVMQIDRRLSLAHQIEFASRIPLAH